PDAWRRRWTPWQIERAEEACIIPVYGRIEHGRDRLGGYNPMWLDWKVLVGVPHDMPVVGYGGKTVNYLRLYSARSSDDFDMQIFSQGDYIRAVEQKIRSETISKVLYPPDTVDAGKELRLLQEYFFVYCALDDIMRRFMAEDGDLDHFADKVAIQLNDTHPALAVADLMRRLIDQHDIPWDRAWEITQKTLAYTNHTLLPEALERWPVSLLEYVVPRHMQIIFEINQKFLERVQDMYPGDDDLLRSVSLVEEGPEKHVRMANLAIVGSHSVNGVAALHSELVKTRLVPDFYRIWPERFNNKTNGVTQRRWLLRSNPELAALITETCGDGWITNLDRLHDLEAHATDPAFQARFAEIKRANKKRLAGTIADLCRITVDPDSLFDIQIKRIHEYKRQLLNVMQVIHHYLRIVEDGIVPTVPRTYIFAGKAAPGYWAAKQIIKLINNVANIVNRDHRCREGLKVAFLPDYRVSLAELIIPAADLSEQISTAGTEASGTGNMKLALNGALTIGTLDGANIEIREEVGPDNIFIFGHTTDEIAQMKEKGSYRPREYYERNEDLRRVVDSFVSHRFAAHEEGIFNWIHHTLLESDTYFHLADFNAYVEAQKRATEVYQDQKAWRKKAILNVARIGKFSSDRTISQYAKEIWDVKPIP
ncbi:MAG: glycogen/starch/alpha-glucan phosphorylase, partial [Deltaproteobacteria bacterium]|nr:glycogen/starch/alpha-glucan phosphorylase [Deltaproteobacteria bacterium]